MTIQKQTVIFSALLFASTERKGNRGNEEEDPRKEKDTQRNAALREKKQKEARKLEDRGERLVVSCICQGWTWKKKEMRRCVCIC